MPAEMYVYEPEGWRVVVLVRPQVDAEYVHEIPGPYLPVDLAEEHLALIRNALGTGENIELPWLALNANLLIAAYLTA